MEGLLLAADKAHGRAPLLRAILRGRDRERVDLVFRSSGRGIRHRLNLEF